jgi:hypothetical protein
MLPEKNWPVEHNVMLHGEQPELDAVQREAL